MQTLICMKTHENRGCFGDERTEISKRIPFILLITNRKKILIFFQVKKNNTNKIFYDLYWKLCLKMETIYEMNEMKNVIILMTL